MTGKTTTNVNCTSGGYSWVVGDLPSTREIMEEHRDTRREKEEKGRRGERDERKKKEGEEKECK